MKNVIHNVVHGFISANGVVENADDDIAPLNLSAKVRYEKMRIEILPLMKNTTMIASRSSSVSYIFKLFAFQGPAISHTNPECGLECTDKLNSMSHLNFPVPSISSDYNFTTGPVHTSPGGGYYRDRVCGPRTKVTEDGTATGCLLGSGSADNLTANHLRKAKLMFFFQRYPTSSTLRQFFPDVKFNRHNNAQLIKVIKRFKNTSTTMLKIVQ